MPACITSAVDHPRQRWLRLLTGLLCGLGCTLAPGPVPEASSAARQPSAQSFPPPTAIDRVLIVAPHPDDETLCCAGLIRRTLTNGGRVAIVWLTSGDAFDLDAMVVEHALRPHPAGMQRLAVMRMAEARQAAAQLGVPAESQYFLGYPDRGLRRLLLDHFDLPYRSTYTGAESVPYPGTVAEGAAYTGRNLERDLIAVISAFRPTLVLTPSPEDAHPDHRAAGELAIRVLAQQQQLDSARYWIVHGGEGWPSPRGLHRELAQSVPPRAPKLPWERLLLTNQEQDRKLAALTEHRSQTAVMRSVMLSFVRRDELFSRTPLPE